MSYMGSHDPLRNAESSGLLLHLYKYDGETVLFVFVVVGRNGILLEKDISMVTPKTPREFYYSETRRFIVFAGCSPVSSSANFLDRQSLLIELLLFQYVRQTSANTTPGSSSEDSSSSFALGTGRVCCVGPRVEIS